MTTKKRTITSEEMKLLGGPLKFAALSQRSQALGYALVATKRKIAAMKEKLARNGAESHVPRKRPMIKQTIDELLQEATIGQLNHLASHPQPHYISSGSCMAGDLAAEPSQAGSMIQLSVCP
jgi:hypothetical protein